MRIFLSYASEDRDIAEQIYLILVKAHHQVFFDHTELPAGDDFNTLIQKAVNRCELFIFLISPNSITKHSYALTELKFAREKWQHPTGHVLPVLVRETSYDLIPPYLKAVSILEPEGNIAAEVNRQVGDWHHRRGYLKPRTLIISLGLLVSLLGGIWVYNHYFNKPIQPAQREPPSIAALDPGFIRFKGNLNREHIIDPLRDQLKNQGLSTPDAYRDPALAETSIEYYDMNHREQAERLSQIIQQYFTSKGYSFQFKVNYSATRPTYNRGAKVVISIYLQ
jgi:hypothetical protein